MSTNAMIGVEMSDGSVKGIRVHWDGYPKWCGAQLLQHYQTEAKALALLELGDLSSIAPTIGEKHAFDNYDTSMCNAYGRDRGETGTEARTYSNRLNFKRLGSGAEFWYLMCSGRWHIMVNSTFRALKHSECGLDEPVPAYGKRVAINPLERAALNMVQAAASCAANGADSAILSLTHNVLTCLSEGNVNRAAEYLSEYRDRIAKGG